MEGPHREGQGPWHLGGKVGAILLTVHVVLWPATVWAAGSRENWPLMVALAMASGIATWVVFRRGCPGVGIVLVMALIGRLAWIGLPPTLSDDAYRYAWDANLVIEGINPYQFRPSDPELASQRPGGLYKELNSPDFYSVYPPLSQFAFAAGALVTNGRFPESFMAYKILAVLLEFLAVLLLARLVAPGFVLLFSWNPLVLMAGAGQGHTDVLLALPLVATVWAARRRYGVVVGAMIAAASMVKLWPGLAAAWLIRRPRGAMAFLLVLIGLCAPFAAGYVLPHIRESLDLYVRYFEFNAGLYLGIKKLLFELTGEDWSKQLGPFLRVVFALTYVGIVGLAWIRKWPLESFLFGIGAAFLLLATTVHPWYFYSMLLLAALRQRPEWAWQWVSVASIGTYLLYVEGPYWIFVGVAWTGFLAMGCVAYPGRLLRGLMEMRADSKAGWLARHLDGEGPILDVGGAEGYVAVALGKRSGRPVTVAEVQDFRRVDVPYFVYDGATLPFSDGAFGAAVLAFTLHHALDAQRVLGETVRVSSGPVVILESVYRTAARLRVLTFLDRWANRLRSMGASADRESDLHFRTVEEWKALFESMGLTVITEEARYNLLHHKHLFVVTASRPPRFAEDHPG